MTWSRLDWFNAENKILKFLESNPQATLQEISRSTNFGMGDTKMILARLRNKKQLKIYRVSAYALF